MANTAIIGKCNEQALEQTESSHQRIIDGGMCGQEGQLSSACIKSTCTLCQCHPPHRMSLTPAHVAAPRWLLADSLKYFILPFSFSSGVELIVSSLLHSTQLTAIILDRHLIPLSSFLRPVTEKHHSNCFSSSLLVDVAYQTAGRWLRLQKSNPEIDHRSLL